MRTVIVIPARYMSTRLPKKVLLDIGGKTLIRRVYDNAIKVRGAFAVYIAVDNKIVYNSCKEFTENVIMTSKLHHSGTDRIAEAVKHIDCDSVINIQGDEPIVDISLIEAMIGELSSDAVNMVSAMHRMTNVDELKSHDSVKVVVDNSSNALYFSRSAIPLHRDTVDNIFSNSDTIPEEYIFYKHIGVYGYKKSFLKLYSALKPSKLEEVEKLEQLRVLENGHKIRMLETIHESIGVDTKEDLERVRKVYS